MNPSVLSILPTDNIGAVEAYRAVYPMQAMSKLGIATAAWPASKIHEAVKNGHHPWASYDLIAFQRLSYIETDGPAFEQLPLMLRAIGKSVVVDYDDDYTNQHRQVTNARLDGLQHFSAITVSTPYLRRVMKPYNRNVHVIPNLVVPGNFYPGRYKRLMEGPVIGLTGSKTHKVDWEAVVEPLREIYRRNPNIKVFCTGYIPDALRDLPCLYTLKMLFPELPTDDSFVNLDEYGGILANIDILLCPVDPDDKFNWSKSNLKAIEGQASARYINGEPAGCCVIASGDLPNYLDAVTHGKTGLLVKHHDAKAWVDAIESVITNVDYRQRLQIAGFQSCMKLWNIHTRINERVATYRDIVERDRKEANKTLTRVAALLET